MDVKEAKCYTFLVLKRATGVSDNSFSSQSKRHFVSAVRQDNFCDKTSRHLFGGGSGGFDDLVVQKFGVLVRQSAVGVVLELRGLGAVNVVESVANQRDLVEELQRKMVYNSRSTTRWEGGLRFRWGR